ncbi:MAG: hypothetical protein OHK0039_46030 [Bacteroidia bacterium]
MGYPTGGMTAQLQQWTSQRLTIGAEIFLHRFFVLRHRDLADRGFQYVSIEWYEGILQACHKRQDETWHGLYASMYTAAMDTQFDACPRYPWTFQHPNRTTIQ